MFREVRNEKRRMSQEEIQSILVRNTSGTLALLGEDGYPYAVPLSYAYADGKLYFHGAKTGHKIDAIRNCHKASFCIIDKEDVDEEEFTTYFASVIAFGTIRILEAGEEKHAAMRKLVGRFAPNTKEDVQAIIEGADGAFCVLEFDIEHVAGKVKAD